MKSWQPEPDEPLLLAWFEPLLALAERAREDEVPWLVHIDQFRLLGRFERQSRPDVWTYAHDTSGRLLFCDADGRAYRFIESRSGPSRGQFRECEVRAAIRGAGLPDVVEPIWFDRPRPRYEGPVDDYEVGDDECHDVDSPRRRGHLRLVVDNRNSA